MLLHNLLEKSSRKYPEKIALIYKGKRWTYKEIDQKANQLARLLQSHGIQRGDRVAIFLDNSMEAVVSLFGILKSNAIFLMLSPHLKPAKLSYILNHCQAKALISQPARINKAFSALSSIPSLNFALFVGNPQDTSPGKSLRIVSWDESLAFDPKLKPEMQDKNIDLDLASIIYTSGSTGNPKGVMLTHRNMTSAAASIINYLEIVPEDIILNALPLSFDYGLYQILMAFQFGGTVVLENSFTFLHEIMTQMSKEKVTGFPGNPTIFSILLQMEDLKKYDLRNLRYITSTGAPLPVNHIYQLRQIFPQAKLYSMYGLTECKRVSYLSPEELDRRPESVGRAMPNTEAWIVDKEGNRAGPGIIGELVVRGSSVMRGYWQDPEATDSVLKPGILPGEKVLYTGDLFKMDKEGFLYFVARKDDMIKSGGERVSPKEIEDVIYSLESVAQVAVISLPDDLLGQAIKAFIVPKKGYILQERELLVHCKKMLEDFAVPKYFEFRDSLPKNDSGKIDKLVLKEESLVQKNS